MAMALKKQKRLGVGVAYEGVATMWNTKQGTVIIIAANADLLAENLNGEKFDRELFMDVAVFRMSDTEVRQ